ncbi:murein hydrolase activator EnvC family protein [Chitinophaga eiseniae]|uniref:Peptidoglycan DD-metalloendopeptidase family protein n=1 Tax=Chitinophaga eiseniae TaxID=634771 RepID=A0A847SR16_9BACT|nr:peptidoglycan DD-metalloendopeptidase family protein [Chitinophaga eiseniae]NLR78512.1 peptidoglycan DD-metalloendopeptidase family protein [Chitinophaga eiseniae]
MRKLIPLLMALWLLPAPLLAQRSKVQSRTVLENRKQELLKEIEAANKALQQTKKSTRQNLTLQRELEQKIASRNQQIASINKEISLIEGDISTTNNNVHTLEKEVDSLRARYAQLVVYAYKTRDSYNVLSFLFSATSFNDAIRRYQYLQQYRENRRRQAENLLSTREQLGQKLVVLQQQRAEKAGSLHQEQQQRVSLLADKKETDQTIAQLKDQEQDLQRQINKSKAEAKQVDQAIQEAIRREIIAAQKKAAAQALARKKAAAAKRRQLAAAREARRKAALAAAKKAHKKLPVKPVEEEKEEDDEDLPPAKTSTEDVLAATPEALSLSRDFEANRGRLPWPVDAGRITGHFGAGRIGKIEVDHNGVIIATGKGAAVKAIFDGEVIMVFMIPGAGYMVTLRHGKYFTNYVRLLDVHVSKGATVKRGQTLGVAATGGAGSGGEIELQIYRNTIKQNPERWIRSR